MEEKELETPFTKIEKEIEKALEAHGYTDKDLSEDDFLEKIWPEVEEKVGRIYEEARQDALNAPKPAIITSPIAAALILDYGAYPPKENPIPPPTRNGVSKSPYHTFAPSKNDWR